jgi:long-chain acyl-CoA synthetase
MGALRRPSAAALSLPGETIDFAALDEGSSRVANGLLALGVDAGDRVAFLGGTSRHYFELLFGAAKINAVTVPLNWRLAPRELGLVLDDSDAKVLVVEGAFEEITNAILDIAPNVLHLISLHPESRHRSYGAWIDQQSSQDPQATASGIDIALQVYTSGTTGLPKGVMISNRALIELLVALAEVARIDGESVTVCALPMFHIGGNAWALAGLLKGCHTALLPEAEPAKTLSTIARLRVTVAFAVPAVIQKILDAPEMAATDCSSLQTLYYGGSPITDMVLQRALADLGCEFVQGFGMTECGLITALQPSDHDPTAHPELLRSCGRALPQNEIRIVDPKTLQEAPTGQVGELWVRSPMMMSGYYEKPDETYAAITPDGWLRTGDAARVDDGGYFFIEDRIKDMIISGGENIYSAEVENVLMAQGAVKECAVVGVPSERWGETVIAVVVLVDGSEVLQPALIEFCRARLAHYKCPTAIHFTDALPRTPSGKVVKQELRRRYGNPDPDSQVAVSRS